MAPTRSVLAVAWLALCAWAALVDARLTASGDFAVELAPLPDLLDPAKFPDLALQLDLNLNTDPPGRRPVPDSILPLPTVEKGLVGPIFVSPINIGIVLPRPGMYFPNVTGQWSTPQKVRFHTAVKKLSVKPKFSSDLSQQD